MGDGGDHCERFQHLQPWDTEQVEMQPQVDIAPVADEI